MMGLTLSDCSVTVALNLNLLGDCVCVFRNVLDRVLSNVCVVFERRLFVFQIEVYYLCIPYIYTYIYFGFVTGFHSCHWLSLSQCRRAKQLI